jgi:transcriptional regulator with GAF, ATPase, and Fis domain
MNDGKTNMGNDEFFRQATLRICGNLEIEEALHSTLLFLKQIFPVDNMYLELYEYSLKAMRVIAAATAEKGQKTDWLTPISDNALQQFRQLTKSMKSDVYLTPIPAKEKLTQEMLKFLNIKATSLMVLKLDSKGKILGTAVFISQRKEGFSAKHSNLISLLKDPFAIAMSNALKHREVVRLKDMLSEDNRYLRQEMRLLSGDEIIGANFGLRDAMEKVQHVATLDSPVLLLGETGVGKDIIANAIHFLSFRKDAPFIKVNCGAIPESLIDSELFGHEKGAFTGAVNQKQGRFERAQSGTILLDEIGDLPLQSQVRLLRVLQDKEIERIGGSKSIVLDIRIIAATNRNLEEMVKAGKFREDLWFRLNVFPIWIPPLRQRKADIPALLNHFIIQKSRELKLPNIPDVFPGQVELLMKYDWPGNVRELQNLIERALILNPKGPLKLESPGISNLQTSNTDITANGEVEKLDIVMSRHIHLALSQCKGKIHGKDGAAQLLGINANTLRSRMKKLGISYHKQNKE